MIRRLALVSLTLGALACGGDEPRSPDQTLDTPEQTLTVQTEQLTATMPVEGTVAARHRTEITTRMMARITSLPVEVGTRVSAGQVLVRLGTEDIAANRAKAEAAVTATQAGTDEARRHAARMDTLFAQDVVAQVQRDQAHLGLAQAESQLALARATLREVETASSYATIEAPFSGAVVARYVDPGDVAAPGMPILVLEDNEPRDAVLAVPADLAAGLRRGTTARVTTADGRTAQAPIRAISAGADPMTRTVEVRAELPADWPTGVSVTGLVPAGTFDGVAIPSSAVIRRGQLTGVKVLTDDGVAVRWIRLGRTLEGDERVQVLSGLEPGDRIVL
ncbi:MAG: efflux RND transporter periplasmic adaptor subunit [Gemmatimonadales bacterium]|nr:efflux RND transporter periplasmic adaptor subunit [Gemmatimonadales bacterium]